MEAIWTVLFVGLVLALAVVVVRFALRDRIDRADEEAAREYFDRHGHWPDEA